MFFLLLFPFLQEISNNVYQPDTSQYQILILIDSPMCSKCLLQLDSIMREFDSTNIKYIIVSNEKSDFLSRKLSIQNFKKVLRPSMYLFFKEKKEFLNFCEQLKVNYFPSIVIYKSHRIKVIKYQDVFLKDIDYSEIKELLINSFKLVE